MYGYESLSRTDARKAEQIDLESGETLYPGLGYGENELRWGFIRKVYGILAVQLLLTTVVSAFVVSSPSIIDLLRGNSGLLLFLCLIPLICNVLSFFFYLFLVLCTIAFHLRFFLFQPCDYPIETQNYGVFVQIYFDMDQNIFKFSNRS